MRKVFLACVIAAVIAAGVYWVVMPVREAVLLPDEVRLTRQEFDAGVKLVKSDLIEQTADRDVRVGDKTEQWIDVKLFGLIPIKRIKVNVLPFDSVLAGGMPVGFIVETDGLIVLEETKGLKKGDIIKRVNGVEVSSVEEFNEAATDTELDIEFIRNGEPMNVRVSAEGTQDDTRHPIGLWLKDETSGVGMLTYINPQNNNFASLGHKLSDFETGTGVDVRGGDVYCCNIVGIEKGSGRKIGEFKSTLKQGSTGRQGSILFSNQNGVFGCLSEESVLLKESAESYPVASRFSVRPGKAKLRTSLDGITVQEYDIEILKNRFQKNKGSKSMIIRVTDKRLLEKTGGIIHGMSGSPIIQNGHIVGALTHVMVSDVTKGYGVYIDFVVPG